MKAKSPTPTKLITREALEMGFPPEAAQLLGLSYAATQRRQRLQKQLTTARRALAGRN
jgi:hypothetical protein